MAFGICGDYFGEDGKTTRFEGPTSKRKEIISALPNKSIKIIKIYNHGAPGLLGDDDVGDLHKMLGDKMQPKSQIHLLGCSTAGVEGTIWNPVGGIGLLSRMIMYNGLMKLSGNEDLAERWTNNLAGDLSRRILGVYVLGLSGISFPLSRIPGISEFEGYEPTAMMGDRIVYLNGRRTEHHNFNLPAQAQ